MRRNRRPGLVGGAGVDELADIDGGVDVHLPRGLGEPGKVGTAIRGSPAMPNGYGEHRRRTAMLGQSPVFFFLTFARVAVSVVRAASSSSSYRPKWPCHACVLRVCIFDRVKRVQCECLGRDFSKISEFRVQS